MRLASRADGRPDRGRLHGPGCDPRSPVAESAVTSSRLLQGIGVLAILALVVGSIAALTVVKERIHVAIAAEEAAARRGPDPIELLRADVDSLSAEVATLNKHLGAALGELRDSLDASAAERERKLAARFDALEAELAAEQPSAT